MAASSITYSKYFFAIILFVSVSTKFAVARDIEIKELKCEYNEEVATNVTCNVKETDGKKRILDLSSTLKREVKDIVVNLRAYGKKDGNLAPLLNVTEDFCKFMDSKAEAFYTEIIVKALRDISNINHPCPYSGYIYVDHINPDIGLLPDSVPSGEYVVEFHLFEYKPENFLGMIRVDAVITD